MANRPGQLHYWAARSVAACARSGAFLPVIGPFFQSLASAYAVGAAVEAIEDNQYVEAFQHLTLVADYDRAQDTYLTTARYILGRLYYEGLGVERNEKSAMRLLELAVAKGSADAKDYLSRVRSSNDDTYTNESSV